MSFRLTAGDRDRNGDFTRAKALEEETAAAGFSAFDGDRDRGLTLGYDNFRHDHALGNIRGDVDQQAAGRSGDGHAERERLTLAGAKGESSGRDHEVAWVDAKRADGGVAGDLEDRNFTTF